MKQITEEQVQEAIAYGISEKDARSGYYIASCFFGFVYVLRYVFLVVVWYSFCVC